MKDGIYNARIEETFLGVEDHGLFVWSLDVGYGDGAHQHYQRILASNSEADTVGVIRALLEAVGVSSWEKLAGMYCRVRVESGLIRAMGHITHERWNDVEARDDHE